MSETGYVVMKLQFCFNVFLFKVTIFISKGSNIISFEFVFAVFEETLKSLAMHSYKVENPTRNRQNATIILFGSHVSRV